MIIKKVNFIPFNEYYFSEIFTIFYFTRRFNKYVTKPVFNVNTTVRSLVFEIIVNYFTIFNTFNSFDFLIKLDIIYGEARGVYIKDI